MKEMGPKDFLSNENELKKNIDIMQMTFEKFGLDVLNVGLTYQKMLGGNGIKFFVEILSNESFDPNQTFYIKINVYDKDGILISMGSKYFNGKSFSGFDTFDIAVFHESIWQNAVKARVYLTKS